MNADYARIPQASPSARRFRPQLWPTLAVALLVPLFLAAGQWQWNKASLKSAQQQALDARAAEAALRMPATPVNAEDMRFRRIVAQGHYEPARQILIDNMIHRQQAGYHVITPLRIEGSDMRLLINRGWVPALADHRQVPQIATPSGKVEIYGTAIVPGTRFFTLGEDLPTAEWQSVWQNLDLQRYGQSVGFPVQPVVIQLDPDNGAGGFVREWRRPDERVQTHLNYAIQWWTFAATTLALWLVFSFRRLS